MVTHPRPTNFDYLNAASVISMTPRHNGNSGEKMDWVLVYHLLTEGPNFTQAYSNQLVLFGNEKLCKDALANMQSEFNVAGVKAKTTFRGTCFQRKGS